MAYHFKLESVLRIRCLEEEKCQKSLAAALHLLEQESLHLMKLLELQKRAELELAEKRQMAMTGPESILHHQYAKKLSDRIRQQQKKVLEADSVCHTKRELLHEALKNRKVLETIKNKDQENYNAELNREEEKFINEIAINRFLHSGR
jgi:flagellar FliJ protein